MFVDLPSFGATVAGRHLLQLRFSRYSCPFEGSGNPVCRVYAEGPLKG